jgi:mannose-6-phosphate isomerase-like protein (cupin superfamily)
MKSIELPENFDTNSPAGASVRLLVGNEKGGMIHSTVPPFQINRAVVHSTVDEFWYVLRGFGEIWQDDGKNSIVTPLVSGVSIELLKGTRFQYRNVANEELAFICVTVPAWPGDNEAQFVDGIWKANV